MLIQILHSDCLSCWWHWLRWMIPLPPDFFSLCSVLTLLYHQFGYCHIWLISTQILSTGPISPKDILSSHHSEIERHWLYLLAFMKLLSDSKMRSPSFGTRIASPSLRFIISPKIYHRLNLMDDNPKSFTWKHVESSLNQFRLVIKVLLNRLSFMIHEQISHQISSAIFYYSPLMKIIGSPLFLNTVEN